MGDNAFAWAKGQDIATEDSYPYKGHASLFGCKSSFTTGIPEGGVTGYKDIAKNPSSLKSALMNGPVSIAIEADQSVFQQYNGETIKAGCGTNLDHGVLAVGINSDGSIKVKNSWGATWGDSGYLNIMPDQCGITMSASVPVVSGSSPAPSPTPAGSHHYEQPPCLPDEMQGQLEDGGVLCAAP